ncbi:MAG: ribonuclease III [uncultured bacterium]|nr:MAG: ribonuclease III [uncultured bacterium]
MIDLSVIIPVYNSEDNLIELTHQLFDSLKSYQFELIFINDLSKDNSWDVIKEICITRNNIIGIDLRKNFGQDNAIMAGLFKAQGNFIVIMDDDLQHSPYDIPALYSKCKEGYDVCYAKFIHIKQVLWKNIGSYINGFVAEILINKPKNIYLSPFMIIKKDIIEKIIEYDGPYPYIQGLIFNITDNITQINIEHNDRYKGNSNYNFIRSFSLFLNLATNFSIIPLRFSTFIGIISSIIGFSMLPYYFIRYLQGNYQIQGWTTLVTLLLIFGGLILLSLGLIGEYLGRIYLKINRKPQYIIKEIITSGK